MVIHVIAIDMRTPGLRFLVTPADDRGGDLPLRARTTSEFVEEFDVQIAINGDGFSPWWSRGPADYYPHTGDPVRPRGEAASRGKVYWATSDPLPTLYINSRNRLSFDAPAKPYNAISGETLLVTGQNVIPDLDDEELHPRTAIGYSRNGRYLYLVVVDGRQPFYSEDITFAELAELKRASVSGRRNRWQRKSQPLLRQKFPETPRFRLWRRSSSGGLGRKSGSLTGVKRGR